MLASISLDLSLHEFLFFQYSATADAVSRLEYAVWLPSLFTNWLFLQVTCSPQLCWRALPCWLQAARLPLALAVRLIATLVLSLPPHFPGTTSLYQAAAAISRCLQPALADQSVYGHTVRHRMLRSS